jgi:hypothetical protein
MRHLSHSSYRGLEIGKILDAISVPLNALATVAIGYFTYTLKTSTDRLWESSDKQFSITKEIADRQFIETQNQIDIARISARAAQVSADAAVAAERGRFFVVVGNHNFSRVAAVGKQWPNSPTMPIDGQLVVTYCFKNYGKTPAVISEISHGIEISPTPSRSRLHHLQLEFRKKPLSHPLA